MGQSGGVWTGRIKSGRIGAEVEAETGVMEVVAGSVGNA